MHCDGLPHKGAKLWQHEGLLSQLSVMPKISAIVYALSSDREHLGKTLDSLQPAADDILLINADASDDIKEIGRRFKARVKNGIPGVTPGAYLMDTYHPWIIVLRPGEALSDELSLSIRNWRRQRHDENTGYRFDVLEQSEGGWSKSSPELRLVNRKQINWTGELPPNAEASTMTGPLLRYDGVEERAEKIA